MNLWLIITGVLIGLVYIGGPLLIFFTQRMKGRPEMRALTTADLNPMLSDFLYGTANALGEDGFATEAYIAMPNAVANVENYLIMLANRETGDKAMVTVMLGVVDGQINEINNYVEFSTRFASGRSYDTLNSRILGSFVTLPEEVKTYLWDVRDVRLLYRLHRHVLTRLSPPPPGDTAEVYDEGEALPHLQQVVLRSYEEQVGTGLLRRIGSGEEVVYAPTLYGAFRMTWAQLLPFSALLKNARQERAHEVLRSYHAEASSQMV